MSLINLRSLLKYSHFVAENFTLNLRSVATSNLLKNQTTVANANEKETVESKPPELNSTSVKEELDGLNKQLVELKEKNSDLLVNTLPDKYKRALADSENLRTRLTKQIEDARIYGIQNFCKDLLDVADVLNKATESVPKEELSEKNPHLKSLYEGLLMTEAQLQTVFKRHGLEPVNPLNEKFDPNLHEALFQQEVQGKEAGVVVVVSKIGYKLHDRVIRPALVGVSK